MLQPLNLPPSLAYFEENYEFRPVSDGRSSATVYRLRGAGREDFFLKVVPPSDAAGLQGEAQRLAWLQGKLPVPEPIDFVEDPNGAHLLTSCLRGHSLTAFNDENDDVKRRMSVLFGEALSALHEVDASNCPFLHSVGHELSRIEAAQAVAGDDETGTLLLELLSATPPPAKHVFTHGDPCLPNVLVLNEELSGFVDLGGAGIGDPYRDLALALWSLDYNFGPRWQKAFLEAYGVDDVDSEKVEYFLKLNSLL